MPSAGSEPAIPTINRRQTYALDRTATGFGIASDWNKMWGGAKFSWRSILNKRKGVSFDRSATLYKLMLRSSVLSRDGRL